MLASAMVAVLALAACPGRRPFCRLGVEHEIGRTHEKQIDAVALGALGSRLIALWSVPRGLYARALDLEARPLAAPLRLGERCEGGVAVLADGGAFQVACLQHPARGKPGDLGGVRLLRVGPDLGLQGTRHLGRAGKLSEGVAMARGSSGIELVWHDASPDAERVWWASLGDGGASARVISEKGRLAAAPSIAAFDGRTVTTWAENWLQHDKLQTRIVAWERRSPTRTLVTGVHVAAMPELFALGSQLVLGYRDHRPHQKIGLYLQRVPARGPLHGSAARVGRADGVGRPALQPCMNGLVAATPRTYGGDYFVGINWLDPTLHAPRGEQQFYEDAHAFTQVAAACTPSHAVLLIAEFPQLWRDSAGLHAVPYACK